MDREARECRSEWWSSGKEAASSSSKRLDLQKRGVRPYALLFS